MQLRCATFNVLADAYLGYGDYSHVPAKLLRPGARIPYLMRLIESLNADVICLQEAEITLAEPLDRLGRWQLFWSQKRRNKPDGCLMLFRVDLKARLFETLVYSDGSGHVAQMCEIGGTRFVNTHIKWAPPGSPNHVGEAQARELLAWIGPSQPAVVSADCNDPAGGRVRGLFEAAGFVNLSGDQPTALVTRGPQALDLLAVRGVSGVQIRTSFRPEDIPNEICPSDHIPMMALVETRL